MSLYDVAFVNSQLSKPTSIFGLRLWVDIGILVGSLIVMIIFLFSLYLTSCHCSRAHKVKPKPITADLPFTPVKSKEIQEIVNDLHVEIGKPEHRVVVYSDRVTSGESRGTLNSRCETASFGSGNVVGPELSHLGWGRWYTLKELEATANGLCEEKVIREGGYGIVYSRILSDGTKVAVKNLLNNRYFVFNRSCPSAPPCW